MPDSTAHPGALLDDLANEPLPSRRDDRLVIDQAIADALADNDGLLHIAAVRQHLARDVAPHMLGAVMSATVSHGDFVWTGEYAPNSGPSGNGAKPAKVWRALTKETT